MNSSRIVWLLLLSLIVPTCKTNAWGLSIPSIATAVVKSAGGLVALGFADLFESIKKDKMPKIQKKDEIFEHEIIDPVCLNLIGIKNTEKSKDAFIGTGKVFLGLAAWNIQMNKQPQEKNTLDQQEAEQENSIEIGLV